MARKAKIPIDGREQEFEVGADVLDLAREDVRDRKGNRIDDAYVEAALADIDRHVGRPSIGAPGTRSPQIFARVPAALKEALQARATEEHRDPSALVRQAVEEYIAKQL